MQGELQGGANACHGSACGYFAQADVRAHEKFNLDRSDVPAHAVCCPNSYFRPPLACVLLSMAMFVT